MPSAPLRIDTSVGAVAGPSSSRTSAKSPKGGNRTPGSSAVRSARSSQRLRSASSASTSSNASNASEYAPDPASTSYLPPVAGAHHASTSAVGPSTPSPTNSKRDSSEYVLAMHDFAPLQENVTCLEFQAGQIIRVLNRDTSGWWDGEVDGRRGWFPSNYVTSDVGLLADEELPQLIRARSGGPTHSQSVPWSSASPSMTSRNSGFARSDHRPMASESSMDTYCPPLMLPLLRALSILQNAVRTNRATHFQPSTAYIISSVRGLLTDVGCLPRDAPILKKHPLLAKERKRILSDLASLVSQSKRASDGALNEKQRGVEVDEMIRSSGQLFAHVRGFLALANQCGVDIQLSNQLHSSERGSLDSEARWNSQEGTFMNSVERSSPVLNDYGAYWNGTVKTVDDDTVQFRQREATATSLSRARSMSALRRSKPTHDASTAPPLPLEQTQMPSLGRVSGQHWTMPEGKRVARGPAGHHKAQPSVSSISSTSSVSSNESLGTPATPMFPTGPSTTAEVMEALRFTHDQYLSTIAAFIGHAHSHSRTSHASSTGHMYDLVREVVEMVCKLLTIVEAVLRHPGIPLQRAHDLRAAKEGLYNVTSTLADSVRQLTSAPLPDVTEEEEKSTLLRSATNALKAGSDCVNAVKKCLQRPTGEQPFIIELPGVGETNPASFTPSKFSHAHKKSDRLRVVTGPANASELREFYRVNSADGDDEDRTIQPHTVPFADMPTRPDFVPDEHVNFLPKQSLPSQRTMSPETDVSSPTPVGDKPLPPLDGRQTARPASPVSLQPTDDGTTWEGAHSQHSSERRSLEEKLRNGDLPAVPATALPEVPPPPSLSWLLSYDHSSEDVAFNSEGQLVGASLAALVERMTPHDSLADAAFSAVFFLTFRQFTTAPELIDTLIERYNLMPPAGLSDEDKLLWQQRKGLPVRLRVANVVKTWLESYWRPSKDVQILPALVSFTRDGLSGMFPVHAQRIMDLVNQRSAAGEAGTPRIERVRDAGFPLNPPSTAPVDIPRPILHKSVLAALRSKNYKSISVTDFDPQELARQLTTMECNLFNAIQAEEVLETGQSGGVYPGNVKAVTSLSTVITGWVAEGILNEPDTKKRTALVKFFIKVADRCASLQNFSTPRSILAALDSSTISRLHQTWSGLPQKNRVQLEALRKLADHARNYHEYRTRLRNTAPPAVPFLGLYLTDITFCREGNPSHRSSPKNPDKKLLNFNKYHKLARIVQDMQRFQSPYNLKEIPEIQDYLRDAFEQSKNRTDLQDLYRRSLLVEPKRPADTPPSGDMRQLFQWATRSQASVISPA
ncbi:hypothetical protein PHLGIDRAFT_125720 [Phlebiopsis gigantea 11061_1 CR5-6]|uniref:Ras GEF n=1 Tax=Phlebiopsis gigantea (strain 11061_1 CR5-6) TaxID=745531 RepID=A0A0C3NXT0_PHLG1|nr:hypothetical protein PHLGIDRAFT_125720 [Phlebiopsis gigantea 11061_1 CR5-6]